MKVECVNGNCGHKEEVSDIEVWGEKRYNEWTQEWDEIVMKAPEDDEGMDVYVYRCPLCGSSVEIVKEVMEE